jgi:hypothetical protein
MTDPRIEIAARAHFDAIHRGTLRWDEAAGDVREMRREDMVPVLAALDAYEENERKELDRKLGGYD